MTHAHDPSLDPIAADFQRHGSYVRRLARALVGSGPHQGADDLSQDVWTAWAAADRSAVRHPRRWLSGVTRRLALRRHRDERHRRARESSTAVLRADGTRVDGEASSPWIDMSDRLQDALRSLDPCHRDVIVLRYLEGCAVGDIALRLGVPASTVTSRLKRGMAAMRRQLDAQRAEWRASFSLLVPAAAGPRFGGPEVDGTAPPPLRLPGGLSQWLSPLLTAVTLMKFKAALLIAVAAGLSAFLWLRADLGGQPARSGLAEAGPPTSVNAELAAVPEATARQAMNAAEEPAKAAPPEVLELPLYCLNVSVTDRQGGPLIGAKVWAAPSDGMPNLIGRTDGRGELQSQWRARPEAMDVDVMVHGIGEEDSGVQRIRVRAGHPFQLTAQLGRPVIPIAALAGELERLEASLRARLDGVGVEDPGELQTRWHAPSSYFLRAERDAFGFVSFLSAASLRSRRVAQTAEAHATTDESRKSRDFDAFLDSANDGRSAGVCSIVVMATDRLGQPANGAPVVVDRPSWDPDLDRLMRGYALDADGRRTIRVPPGETIVSIGQGAALREETFQVEPGATLHWPIELDRSGHLLLQLKSASSVDWSGTPVLVRCEHADSLWFARQYPNEEGFIAIAGSPEAVVEVHLLGQGDVAPLSVASFPGVVCGEKVTLDVDANRRAVATVRLAPLEPDRELQRARQVIVFEEGRRFGAMADLSPTAEAIYEFRVPVRTLRIEATADRSTRTVIEHVALAGDQRSDLGTVPLPELVEVTVQPPDVSGPHRPTVAEFYRVDGAVDLLVAQRTVEGAAEVVEHLAEGGYRVVWKRGEEALHANPLAVRRRDAGR